jgi:hypothetical protein
MQARLGRPTRDAEQLGDPGERQVEVEVQDDQRALLFVGCVYLILWALRTSSRDSATSA